MSELNREIFIYCIDLDNSQSIESCHYSSNLIQLFFGRLIPSIVTDMVKGSFLIGWVG